MRFISAPRLWAVALSALAMFLLVGTPEAMAAGLHLAAAKASAFPGLHELTLIGANALVALRADLSDLTTRATAKLAEIKDDTPAERATAIEAEHAELTRQIEAKRTEITTAEAAAAAAAAEAEAQRATPAILTQADVDAAAQRALETRDRRVAEISAVGRTAEMPADQINAAIADTSVTVDAFRIRAFDFMADKQRKEFRPSSVQVITDEGDSTRRGITDAVEFLLQQRNPSRPRGDAAIKPSSESEKFRSLTLVEMAAEFIGHRGNIRQHQVDQIMARAMHSTSDFPGLLMDAMNRRLLSRYALAQPTYRRFSTRLSASDFRAMNVLRAGDFPSLQPIKENGEIVNGTFSESKEKFQVSAYGIQFAFSRVMIVNDQLGAIDQVIGGYGASVANWENVQAYTLFLSNPALLTDNVAVFAAGHNNLAGSGSAISIASLGAGRAAMMKQKTLDGMPANVSPMTLLCSPDKLTGAEQILAPLTLLNPASRAEVAPESIARIAPMADQQLTGTAWYLLADPAEFPVLAYGFLNGNEAPRFATEESWNTQGMKVKVEHDFGVSAIDFRGGYKDGGA